MKFLIFISLLSLNIFAQEREGDLNLPVSDETQIERQEEEEIPSIEEVPMYQEKTPPKKQKTKTEKNDDLTP